jgi:hypothetical protein
MVRKGIKQTIENDYYGSLVPLYITLNVKTLGALTGCWLIILSYRGGFI